MSKIIKTFTVKTKAIDVERGVFEAMVSTESVDRDGDILQAAGADVSNYLKNPVVLWGHNYWMPDAVVAKALEIEKIVGRGVRIVFQFVQRGVNATADLVRDLWAGGYLNAMSVGFIPKQWERRKDINGETLERGLLYSMWEFLEGSIVTIPANQDALRLAFEAMKAKGYDETPLKRILFEGETKRGRVLSAANEKRIREAVAALGEVLSSLGEEEQEAIGDIAQQAALPEETPEMQAYSAGAPQAQPLVEGQEQTNAEPNPDAAPAAPAATNDESEANEKALAQSLNNYFSTLTEVLK